MSCVGWAEMSTLPFVLSYPFSPRWSQCAPLCIQAEIECYNVVKEWL